MRTLIFVYNAASDIWSKSLDAAHKIISPSTYACNLCSLTHGNFSEKQVWVLFDKEKLSSFHSVNDLIDNLKAVLSNDFLAQD